MIKVRQEVRTVAAQAATNPSCEVNFAAAEAAESILRGIESGEYRYANLPTGLTIAPSGKAGGEYFHPFIPQTGVRIILGDLLPFKKELWRQPQIQPKVSAAVLPTGPEFAKGVSTNCKFWQLSICRVLYADLSVRPTRRPLLKFYIPLRVHTILSVGWRSYNPTIDPYGIDIVFREDTLTSTYNQSRYTAYRPPTP